ncbi:MAG: hypothetical protein AAF958_07870 [Planctomycetota bacterium]
MGADSIIIGAGEEITGADTIGDEMTGADMTLGSVPQQSWITIGMMLIGGAGQQVGGGGQHVGGGQHATGGAGQQTGGGAQADRLANWHFSQPADAGDEVSTTHSVATRQQRMSLGRRFIRGGPVNMRWEVPRAPVCGENNRRVGQNQRLERHMRQSLPRWPPC